MALSLAQWGNSLHSGERTYPIVPRRKMWFAISGTLILISLSFVFFRGLNPGIDFQGGSEFVVSGTTTTEQSLAIDAVQAIAPGETPRVTIAETNGEYRVQIRFGEIDVDESERLTRDLADAYGVSVSDVSQRVVGPTWGADVTKKALTGLAWFLGLVTIVMSLYFRAWRMAVAALIALAHDLLFTIGVYAAVGFEVTPASVIGFLTILGYSLYDTVVVFDKVRENTENVTAQNRYTYGELANLAVNQTLVRSINTSIVALLPVSAILFVGAFLFGAGTLKDIALALFVGMAVGTYSSVFVATPAEVALRAREAKIRDHTAKVLRLREAGEGATVGDDGHVRVGALQAGHHQGVAAQPRRKRRS